MKELPPIPEPAWVTRAFWDAINEWMRYKAEKRQGYKPIGYRAMIKHLFKNFSSEQEVIDAIEYSMAQNYQGIFAERKQPLQEQPKKGTFDPTRGPGLSTV